LREEEFMKNSNPLPTHRRPTTPGEYIDELFLKPRGLAQQQRADALRIDLVGVNAITKGRRSVTLETALRLEKVLGPSAGFWLNFQRSVDLWDAMHSDAVNKIKRLRMLSPERQAGKKPVKSAI
jgi:addiction module HigA family antidote